MDLVAGTNKDSVRRKLWGMAVGLAGSLQGDVPAQHLQIENSRLGDLHTSSVCFSTFLKKALFQCT